MVPNSNRFLLKQTVDYLNVPQFIFLTEHYLMWSLPKESGIVSLTSENCYFQCEEYIFVNCGAEKSVQDPASITASHGKIQSGQISKFS